MLVAVRSQLQILERRLTGKFVFYLTGRIREYPHIIMPGPHGLIVQALDTKEKAAINQRHAGLTQKLCKLKQAWCVPQEHREHTY